jgi:hypothetical protein
MLPIRFTVGTGGTIREGKKDCHVTPLLAMTEKETKRLIKCLISLIKEKGGLPEFPFLVS